MCPKVKTGKKKARGGRQGKQKSSQNFCNHNAKADIKKPSKPTLLVNLHQAL